MQKIVVLMVATFCFNAVTQPIRIPEVAREDVICFALYTVHDNVLKLTAQLYPLEEGEDRTLFLEIEEDGDWRRVAEAHVIEAGWTAPFRVEDWDDSREVRYRVNHMNRSFYAGTIRKNPIDDDEFVVAAFSCNSVREAHGGDIPKFDIVENIQRLQPDLLAFLGDQVYHHTQHYAHWLKFGRDFGDILRDFPTVCIPDDHDVGHANLWGEGGVKSSSSAGADGGYFMPVAYVQEVERAQTSHLPDPYDPSPIERGIGVYYTDLTWGGVSFAIIEDRKWKTGPDGVVPEMGPRPDHIATADYDPAALDVPGAKLLGERQLAFLRDWAADWESAEMKAVLSQTVFAGAAHLHGEHDYRLYADLDANGWPQTGRNKALREIRKAFAVMIAGDQHLGSVIHHGIDDWNDAGYQFTTPAIANLYLRWWDPLAPGKNRRPASPEYTGEFLDGFGNKMTMLAAANPDRSPNGDRLTTRAAGFGVIRFNKPDRTITFECWPRNTDVTGPDSNQYPGWPITVRQQDNYAREAVAYLPVIALSDAEEPIIQVVDDATGDIVYTLRINGARFRPKVFREGTYTIHVIKNGHRKTFRSLTTGSKASSDTIRVELAASTANN